MFVFVWHPRHAVSRICCTSQGIPVNAPVPAPPSLGMSPTGVVSSDEFDSVELSASVDEVVIGFAFVNPDAFGAASKCDEARSAHRDQREEIRSFHEKLRRKVGRLSART